MAEVEAADQIAAETPSEEAQVEETELQPVEGQDGEEVEEPEDDSEELEYEGEKYKVPKKLKSGFMMQSDYTKKTQEVAEQRKAIESERQQLAKEATAQRDHIADIGRVKVFDETLEQYSKVDWQTLRAQDPERANAAFQDYMQMRDQRDRLAEKVSGEIQKQRTLAEQQFAKRYEEASSELARDIKGWNADTASKVRDFALKNGITVDELREVAVNSKLSKILHKAWLGEQLIAKQQTAAKAAVAKPPVAEVKPLTVIGKPTAVTREALRVLHQKLNFIPDTDLQYDDQYAKTGAKIGTDLKIRTPNQYVVRKGASLSAQDTVESSVTLTVASQYGVDLNFTSVDLTLSLDDFSKRIIDPAMAVLAANIEGDALAASTRTSTTPSRTPGSRRPSPTCSTPASCWSTTSPPPASGRSTCRRRTTSTSSTR
jgi:hypothetical protein